MGSLFPSQPNEPVAASAAAAAPAPPPGHSSDSSLFTPPRGQQAVETVSEQPSQAGAGHAAKKHPFHPHMVVRRGVLSEACGQVMKDFFRRRRKESKESWLDIQKPIS